MPHPNCLETYRQAVKNLTDIHQKDNDAQAVKELEERLKGK